MHCLTRLYWISDYGDAKWRESFWREILEAKYDIMKGDSAQSRFLVLIGEFVEVYPTRVETFEID